MMKSCWLRVAVVTGLSFVLTAPGFCARARHQLFLRDAMQEEYLKCKADPDHKITPARVLRWIQGLRGTPIAQKSSTEFQPTVDTHNGNYRVIAALTYKF